MLTLDEIKITAQLKYDLYNLQKEYARLVRERASSEEKDKVSERIAKLTTKLYVKPKYKTR